MSNRMLWRYGATNPRVSPVDSAQVVEIGDLVWLNTDDVRPASAVSYAAGLSQAQETLVDDFLGVAMQSSPSGNTEDIRVATTGVFEFDCAADTFELGDLVAAADNSGSTALEDQKVVSLGDGHADADVPRAIGKAAKVAASNVTRVLVEIRSTVMTGGYPLGTASV